MRPVDDHYSYHSRREQYRLERAFDDFVRHMEAVRDAQPEWLIWIEKGQPVLTPEQYERVLYSRRRKS